MIPFDIEWDFVTVIGNQPIVPPICLDRQRLISIAIY